MSTKFVNSFTLKEITGIEDFSKHIPKISEMIVIIQGRVTGYKTESGQYGEQSVLYGSFEGIDCKSGEIVAGETAYLPTKLSDKIVSQLNRGDGLEVVGTDFQCAISIQPSKKAAKGYRFVAHPVPTEDVIERQSGLLELYQSTQQLQISEKTAK